MSRRSPLPSEFEDIMWLHTYTTGASYQLCHRLPSVLTISPYNVYIIIMHCTITESYLLGGEGGCVYWMNIISLLCLYLFCCTLFSHTADCTVIQIMELSTIIIMYQPTLQKPCCVVCAIYNHTELKPRFSMLTNTSMLLNWLAKVTSLELSTLPSIAFR